MRTATSNLRRASRIRHDRFRVISFVRVFDEMGALVRMIVKIAAAIRPFIAIVSILGVGFWVTFALLARKTPSFALAVDLMESGLYADIEEGRMSATLVVVLQIYLFAVALVMLNLLIAIMNSAYEQVRQATIVEVMFEKWRAVRESRPLASSWF